LHGRRGIERSHGQADFRLDKTFLVYGLPQRSGRFELRLAGSSKVLADIDNVLPGARGGASDPRLQNIDLRAKSYSYVLSFVDGQGAAIKGLSLESPSFCGPQVPYEEGALGLATASNPLEIVVRAPGFRALSRSLIPGRYELAMELGLQVQVTPSWPLESTPGSLATLVLIGIHLDEELELTRLPDGSHKGTLSSAGEYSIVARIWRQGKRLADIPIPGQVPFVIVERAGLQAFPLNYDSKVLEQQLAPR
jgi:hypothetical protein